MKNDDENIDRLIREALDETEAEAYDDLGEQNMFSMAVGALTGRNRLLKGLMVVMAVVFAVLAVYSADRFFRAEVTKDLIAWAAGFFLFVLGTMAMKVWWWMEMQRNATIREIKRVELQLAHLAGLFQRGSGDSPR